MKSTRLYQRAKELFNNRNDLFQPEDILEKYRGPEDENLIADTGAFLGTRYPRQTARNWYENTMRLQTLFAGDPRNLFSSHNNARRLLKEITAFRGYGPKIGGMLLRAIVGLGFNSPEGLEDVLVPVDIHDSRISFYTKIVTVDEMQELKSVDYYSHVRQIQAVLRDTCKSLGLPWLDIDRALWLVGSRGCAKQHCSPCPINEFCLMSNEMEPQLELEF